MISDRPEGPPMPAEMAIAEIERNAGSQFDPEIARLFVSMMREEGLGEGKRNGSSNKVD